MLRRVARGQKSIPLRESLAVGLLDLLHSWEIWTVHLLFRTAGTIAFSIASLTAVRCHGPCLDKLLAIRSIIGSAQEFVETQ